MQQLAHAAEQRRDQVVGNRVDKHMQVLNDVVFQLVNELVEFVSRGHWHAQKQTECQP